MINIMNKYIKPETIIIKLNGGELMTYLYVGSVSAQNSNGTTDVIPVDNTGGDNIPADAKGCNLWDDSDEE